MAAQRRVVLALVALLCVGSAAQARTPVVCAERIPGAVAGSFLGRDVAVAVDGAVAVSGTTIDSSHARFPDLIRSEHLVTDGSGNLLQVDNAHRKYFVNSTITSHIATIATTSLDDLRGLGLNPDDFRETRAAKNLA